jgi:NTP pyrophosphatase (non-canonical NTP hydrolase)
VDLNDYQDEAAKTDLYGEVFTKEQVIQIVGYMSGELEALHPVEAPVIMAALEEAIEQVGYAPLVNAVFGITGEGGELAELVKKMIRDDEGVLTDERRDKGIKELGDLLWYAAKAARDLGVPLSEVAQINLDKLRDRQARGVLRGSGDDR